MSSPDPQPLETPAASLTTIAPADPLDTIPAEPDTAADPDTEEERPAGVPGWLVLAALIFAVAAAVFIVGRIGGSLSALISPPDPVLPPQAVLQSRGSDHVGDYWVYSTPQDGCMTAKFYQEHIGNCSYDPASGCNPDGSAGKQYAIPGPMSIAACTGSQTIGQYHLTWQVNISVTNDNQMQSQGSTFRIYRDLG